MSMLTHAEAHSLLHAGRQTLSAADLHELDAHLKACPECRAYAAYLHAAEPRLAQALRARWGSASPAPLGDYVRRVQARAGGRAARRGWGRVAAGWPLAGAAALLVLALVWVSRQGGAARTSGPGATATSEVATLPVTTNPLPTLGAPVPQPASGSGLIAFLSRQGRADDVFVMRPDGSGPLNLTNHPAHDTAPAWSPDGSRLAFVSDRTGQPELFTVRPDGSDLTQLTETDAPTPDYDYVFDWAPDGSARLALALVPHDTVGDWRGGLFMIFETAAPQPVPGEGARLLAEQASDLRWGPGDTIAYLASDENGNPTLFSVGAPSSTSYDLVNWRTPRLTPPPEPGQFNLYLGFDWSPDPHRLAYLELGPWIGEGSDAVLAPEAAARIVVVDPDSAWRSGDPRPQTILELSPAPSGIRGLRWSPDGSHLLYLVGQGSCWFPVLVPLTSPTPVQLRDVCYAMRTALPDFSSDGRHLLLSAQWGDARQGAGVGLVDIAAALQAPADAAVVPLIDHAPLDHSPAAQPGAAFASVCNLLHTVAAGETALTIAQQYGLSLADLGARNGLDDNYTLAVRRTLVIPRACSPSEAPPAFDPLGGRLLAYAATEGDNWDIFVTDGQTETRLTTGPGDHLAPAWSPDGQRLAFLSSRRGGATDLYVMQADGTGQTLLSPNAWLDGPPQWLPDGQQISFVTQIDSNRYEWRLINADGTGERTLLQFATWPPEIHWSPDGLRIAFVSYADRGARDDGDGEIYTMNPDGSDPIRLTFSQWVHDRYPVWSPDGRQIAYFTNPGNAYGLWLMNSDGTGKHRLVQTETVQPVSWSPDSRRLVYAEGHTLHVISAFGQSLAQIETDHQSVQSPAWQP